MELKSIPSAIQSGLNGYQTAERGLAQAADNISKLNLDANTAAKGATEAVQQAPQVSLTTEAVNLVVNEHLAKANSKVIQTADEVVGTLIDTKV
ncbi:flagellar basal body rod C-terminal domain-containing protein [Psychrosphaera haliotis]|uniref:Uncharacterized protein n=1 Tax=Psychrosphaera haliotis TaxID=555083 RepID=A0A6N8FEP8_9GAMM|nr:flagellar basal body rod C-terminal domain-containing protein [Psychrosphaera haliotis]MUH73460.1 hypothetical protein [Psychrosphaera haliotis]